MYLCTIVEWDGIVGLFLMLLGKPTIRDGWHTRIIITVSGAITMAKIVIMERIECMFNTLTKCQATTSTIIIIILVLFLL